LGIIQEIEYMLTKNSYLILLCAAICLFSSCKEAGTAALPRGEASPEMTAAVDSFFEATKAVPDSVGYINLHSIMIVKNGKVLVERWYNGESADKPHIMWSVSKTFTSAAAGLAISEGLLKLDDKLVSFFPEDLPQEVSENLAAVTVRDLLTMNCGQQTEISIDRSDSTLNWTRIFLNHPFTRQPGTYFRYNSYGTYMVSAIVQKVTGQKINDYLESRLWQPLGIEKPEWDESHQGINCGGWGLHLKTEDMAKMGQLILQGGEWNGKPVLPADWVKEMSSYQVQSYANERPDPRADWNKGYGYQMWMCQHGAFRADGANGQYIIIIPDKNVVIAITTDANLYQPYMDIIWEYLYPVL